MTTEGMSRVTLTSEERDYIIDLLETQDEMLRSDLDQDPSPQDAENLNKQRQLISVLFSKI